MGSKYDIDIQVTSKPKAEYVTDDYFELDLPVAPAVMVGDEVVVEGSDIAGIKIEEAICRHLDLPPPEEKKSFFGKLFGGKLQR